MYVYSSSNIRVCLAILLLIPSLISYAQEDYQTKNGTLLITTNGEEETNKFQSNSVQIILDLKRAEFEFKLPIQSLHTDIDSLKKKLIGGNDNIFQVKGLLNLNEIKTEPHVPLHFRFDATISNYNFSRDIKGYGHLEHIPGKEQPACQLSLNFEIDDFEITKGIKDDFRFQVVQSILYQSDKY